MIKYHYFNNKKEIIKKWQLQKSELTDSEE